jgi:PKD repeat protein
MISATADGDAGALLAQLNALGMRHGAMRSTMVSGLFPLAALDQALALSGLKAIFAVPQPIVHTGSVTSQGDVPLRADLARLLHGVDGSGIRVGIISDSFDNSGVVNLNAADDVASGDLPPDVQVLSESDLCGVYVICIDEGRAMAQIVHDLAPGADILFHTVYGSEVDFAIAIDQLRQAEADVIVDDVLYLSEPMFEDGIVARAVDDAVAADVAYYSAAGNQARQSYESAFEDSNTVLCIEQLPPYDDCDPLFERVGLMHDFDPGPGVDVFQDITIPVGGSISLAMQWDQAFGNAKNDHIIVLLSHDAALWITIAANDNVITGAPWELLQYQNVFGDFGGPTGDQFKIAITYDDVDSIVAPANLLKTVAFGSGTSIDSYQTNSATLIGHANAAGAAAVGAAYWADTPELGVFPPLLEPFSSAGGTPILFGASGNRLVEPVLRDQPKVVAADGVNTTFFFNDVDDDGIPDFFGTSAAAPHAAAVAALMLEASPGSTPQQVYAAMQGSAIDMGPPGFDTESGAGLIQADTAVDVLAAGSGMPPNADFSHDSNELTVTFADLSSDPDGTLVNHSWDFGDGSGSTAQSPTHVYSIDGAYQAALTVTDNDANVDSVVHTVTIAAAPPGNQPPQASYSYVCQGLICQFTDTSSDPDGDTLTWLWDFGDGNSSTIQNPSKDYANQGNRTVSLQVDDGNAADTASATFRVKNRGGASGSTGSGSGTGDTGGLTSEKGRKKCSDGIDNDGDGLIDGADPGC